MQPNSLEAALARPKLGFHDYSRTISKLKPKIRIIHIVEPEIIKTTAEDFQALVQRLTGKPVERKQCARKGNNASSLILQPRPYCSKTEPARTPIVQETQRMNIEVEDIYDAEDQTAFAGFMEHVDGFLLHDVNEFPLFSFRPSQINIFGEMPLC